MPYSPFPKSYSLFKQIDVVGVPFYSSDTIENVIGRAVSKMTEYDPHYWAVAGHGDGGSVASILAKTMHVSIKLHLN